MGSIHSDVQHQILEEYPDNEEFLKPFLEGFDITWGKRRRAYNAELNIFFLKPSETIAEVYGFPREILLVYSEYPRLESRTIQAAEQFLLTPPGNGRVDNFNYILVSEDPHIEEWVHQYLMDYPEARIIIPFFAQALREAKGDAYFFRRILNKNLYERDLFALQLPLMTDFYFFGRQEIVKNLIESASRGENRALFGLRKTGKTSIIFKVERQIKASGSGFFFYYDCKQLDIRRLRWYQLLEKILRDICRENGFRLDGQTDEIGITETFRSVVERSDESKKIVLVFDEIEYISPVSQEDHHWKKDFVYFWQTFWAVQSRQRKICAILVGVNPYPVEVPRVSDIQNPLFGIVPYSFLVGLDFADMRKMVTTLGKKMGLRFDYDSVKYLYERYGGHPFLTRLTCTFINNQIKCRNEEKPVDITQEKLKDYETTLDSNLYFYSESVVSELKYFYPSEYELLELLASRQTTEFINRTRYQEDSRHLVDYGLLSSDEFDQPKISIAVISRYVGLEYMKREQRQTIFKPIESQNRDVWLYNIKRSILNDLRNLESAIHNKKMVKLFGPNSFPEADEFMEIGVVHDKATFVSFLNTSYRCFVESIDNYGKSLDNPRYYESEIKSSYPRLWDSLQRLRVYRNAINHKDLRHQTHDDLEKYVKIDLQGQPPDNSPEQKFIIQQCVLESLLSGIQYEKNRIT